MEEALYVRDAMRTIVITVHVTAFADEAARLLVAHGVNSLPVVETRGRVVGMLGIKDLLRSPMPRHWWHMPMDPYPALDKMAEQLRTTPVIRLMASNMQTIAEDALLGHAAARMANSGMHPLLVINDGQLVGLLSRSDVLRCILEQAPTRVGLPQL